MSCTANYSSLTQTAVPTGHPTLLHSKISLMFSELKLYIVLYYTNMPCYSCVFTDAKGEVMTSSTTVALVSSEITNKDEEGVNKLKYNTF